MSKLYRSTIGGLAIYGHEFGMTISEGQVVDLDTEVAPGHTLEDSLGRRYLPYFYPVVDNPIPAPNPPGDDDDVD
jgi:hypothetical protein